jgi:hypothetical protein
VKEKATYRRFDLLAFLAILGCIGMLIFECIFIFELYNRAPAQITNLLPVQTPAATNQPAASLPKGTNAPAASQTNPPAVESPVVEPVAAPPAEPEKAPARSESLSAPVVAPVG